MLWGETVGISQGYVTGTWQHLPLTTQLCRRLTGLQLFCKGDCCALFGGCQCSTRCEPCTGGINNKKDFLILSLLSVTSNLMVNKNTVSQVAKLLMQPQFQISPLQFFRNVSFLSCSSYCWFIYFLYLFSLCLAGFFPPFFRFREL